MLAGMEESEADSLVCGRPVAAYVSEEDGVETTVYWLKEAELPALIRVTKRGAADILRLEWIGVVDEAAVKPPDSSRYTHIDHADVGDHASDPVLRQILSEHRH